MKAWVYAAVVLLAAQGPLWAQGPGRSAPEKDSAPRQASPGSSPGAAQPGGAGLPSATEYSSAILPDIKGVVPWRTLSQVVPTKIKDRYLPQFSANVIKLDRKAVRVQGFMVPLDVGDGQKRFLLSAVPPSCQYCMPAGPDALVMVQAKSPVKYSIEPIVMSGKFAVLKDDAMGLYYRLDDAVAVNAK